MTMTREEKKAAAPEVVRAGMNLDIDAEALAIATQLASDIDDKLCDAAAQKQAPYERSYVRRELAGDLVPAVKAYLVECLSDSSLWNDWEWSFMREVISPALGKCFTTPRYSGFGPKSVTMRFKKCHRTPEFGNMMTKLDVRYRSWLRGFDVSNPYDIRQLED